MKALVVFRSCISTRITRTKELERQARDLGSQQLTTLTTQHSELQTQYSKQIELYKRMEVNITTLTESEKRLNDKIMNLEKQREDDREAASILREKVAQTAAIEMDKLDSAEVAKELALEKSKSMELEEKCRQHLIDLTQLKEESTMNISELTRVRLLQTESETQSSNLLMKLNEEEKKNNTYTVENENLKTRLGEMEVELETAGKSIQSEAAAREWSTVVDISITPPYFKPVSLSLSRSPLSKTPKQVFFNPMNIFDIFYHTLFAVFIIYFFSF